MEQVKNTTRSVRTRASVRPEPFSSDQGEFNRYGAKKRAAVFLLSWVAALFRTSFGLFRKQAQQRSVTMIEPFGLGDVIAHEPLVTLLRAHGFRVTFCARRSWREVLQVDQWVDCEVPWASYANADKYRRDAFWNSDFRMFLRKLKQSSAGSIGIDTRGDIRSVLLLYLSGCYPVITLDSYLGCDLRIPKRVGITVPWDATHRRWENCAACAIPLRLDTATMRRPSLAHLARKTEFSGIIAFMPVVPWAGRLWQPKKWQTLAAKLQEEGERIIVLCGPNQINLAREQVGKNLEIIECDSISTWIKALARCAVLVTLDSGPMHLADALDVPLVALFGPGQMPLWSPSGPASRIVTHQGEAGIGPCVQVEANLDLAAESMRRITVEEVLSAIRELLAFPRESRR